MNIQQPRYLSKSPVAPQRPEAAEALRPSRVSSRSACSRRSWASIVFVRHGKRLVAVTEPGRQVLAIAERMLLDVDNLRQVGAEFSNEASGSLSSPSRPTPRRATRCRP